MTGPRIVETPDGLAMLYPPGTAERQAAVLGRYEALRPDGNGTDPDLRALRRQLLELESRYVHGEGVDASGPGRREGPPVFDWLSSAEVARLTGVSARAVTAGCCSGRFPGAHHVAGHGWFIPAGVLPDVEDMNDDDAERGCGDAA